MLHTATYMCARSMSASINVGRRRRQLDGRRAAFTSRIGWYLRTALDAIMSQRAMRHATDCHRISCLQYVRETTTTRITSHSSMLTHTLRCRHPTHVARPWTDVGTRHPCAQTFDSRVRARARAGYSGARTQARARPQVQHARARARTFAAPLVRQPQECPS